MFAETVVVYKNGIEAAGDHRLGGITMPAVPEFVPRVQSGSFADMGCRRCMEDEHIRIDDLSAEFGTSFCFPKPSAFYGVFDGHGGAEAASYVKKNVLRLFLDNAELPRAGEEVDDVFLQAAESSLRSAFLLADLALANDCSISSCSGTTALAMFLSGRSLVVANAGDCRAVLCRHGRAVDLSCDHRPVYPPERKRVEELGGYVDDGYLNGVLSVSRALGDWDMKLPAASQCPLTAEPELRRVLLTEEDEFVVMGSDGIWDVITSQQAVCLVRRGLRQHDDPERCARELGAEAARRNTCDNVTVVVVCLASTLGPREASPPRRERTCSLSPEALRCLHDLLNATTDS